MSEGPGAAILIGFVGLTIILALLSIASGGGTRWVGNLVKDLAGPVVFIAVIVAIIAGILGKS